MRLLLSQRDYADIDIPCIRYSIGCHRSGVLSLCVISLGTQSSLSGVSALVPLRATAVSIILSFSVIDIGVRRSHTPLGLVELFLS